MDTAKVLIAYDECDKPQAQEEGLDVIRRIPNDFGIVIKAAIGPGRIGKSSILNQLIHKGNIAII